MEEEQAVGVVRHLIAQHQGLAYMDEILSMVVGAKAKLADLDKKASEAEKRVADADVKLAEHGKLMEDVRAKAVADVEALRESKVTELANELMKLQAERDDVLKVIAELKGTEKLQLERAAELNKGIRELVKSQREAELELDRVRKTLADIGVSISKV